MVPRDISLDKTRSEPKVKVGPAEAVTEKRATVECHGYHHHRFCLS